ncbi:MULTISPECIES: peptidase S10 [unclassified Chelatococcus]|uniref:S10 family peptidase n=1 Tax=unclassified Chelatococcus TaxID=2638111 RepID=UPI001BCD9793|nr:MULTISPECIES: peptidase S10 [unclassified Chelatococcus]MBS7699118.1 peptidase S10 [Chelatococcus sp. YT9]MBX3554899.1 peptidase S10 [Chelatococcus sp.]
MLLSARSERDHEDDGGRHHRRARWPARAVVTGALLGLALLSPIEAARTVVAQEPVRQGQEPARQGGQAEASQGPGQRQQRQASSEPADLRLPAPVTTSHSLPAALGSLKYKATAGSIVLNDQAGRPTAEIAYVAYVLDGQDPATRPIAFAFNGGPGAASAYLHFGAMGPQRLPFGNQGQGPSSPPILTDNPETWLPFTDLVFVDPVGTGFSRFLREDQDLRQQFWSVSGDVASLSRFVTRYLTENDRLRSPKVLVGESYGGFRVPKIARALQGDYGVGINGLYIISPVLDFNLKAEGLPFSTAARLPSLVAAARAAKGEPLTREGLAEVEAYALGDYLVDVLKGPRDKAAVARIVDKVHQLTGLDRDFLARAGGQPDMTDVARELGRPRSEVASYYDALITGLDQDPWATRASFDDPVLDASMAPLTSATVDYTRRVLNYEVNRPYELLNGEINRRWSWGTRREGPEAARDLRAAMALDPSMTVVVTHGFTDLVTPYLETRLVLDRLPPTIANPERLRLEVVPGGHMFYTRDDSRKALRDSAERLFKAVGQRL